MIWKRWTAKHRQAAGIWPYVVLIAGIAVVAVTHRLAVY